jgi:hypothetical protein
MPLGIDRTRERGINGPPSSSRSREASERACYLAEQLRALCWPELGVAGRRFVDGLSSALKVLDPPPQPGVPAFIAPSTNGREAGPAGAS